MAQSFTANDICTELEKSERKEKTQTLQVLFLTQSQQEVPVPTAVGGGFTFQHMFRMEQSYRPRGGSGRAASSPLPPCPPPRPLQPPWPCRGLSSWWLPCPCGSGKGAQPPENPRETGAWRLCTASGRHGWSRLGLWGIFSSGFLFSRPAWLWSPSKLSNWKEGFEFRCCLMWF